MKSIKKLFSNWNNIRKHICPKCKGKLIERGFSNHNRRWECSNCDYVSF